MTNKNWNEEVSRAIAGAGLPWRVAAAWIEQSSALCCAELADTRSGAERRISLSPGSFPTTADRRNEIIRQLQHPPRA